MSYAVIRAGSDTDEDAEAYGPFTTRDGAERFADGYGEWVDPSTRYLVTELLPIRAGRQLIKQMSDG